MLKTHLRSQVDFDLRIAMIRDKKKTVRGRLLDQVRKKKLEAMKRIDDIKNVKEMTQVMTE